MKSVDAAAQIEIATVKYLAVSLTPDTIKSISLELALKHRVEASAYYASKQHPPPCLSASLRHNLAVRVHKDQLFCGLRLRVQLVANLGVNVPVL